MEQFISDIEKFSQGAFTLNESSVAYSPFPDCSSIFLTQQGNTALRNEILRLISESCEVIKICSFIITDRDIYEAILNKAKSSNTAIFILTQLDQEKLKDPERLSESITEEEIKENTAQIHLSFINKLYEQGVHVRATTSAHAKFIIADRRKGFITSANLTTPSLTINTESGVYLNERDANELDKLFDVIFLQGTTYRQYIGVNRTKTLVVQNDVTLQKKFLPNHEVSSVRYTYENATTNLYGELIRIIRTSKEFIYLSTFSIVGLEFLPELTDEIRNAIGRGVNINIFCRGMNHRSDHLTGCEILKGLGCIIFGDGYNHSKAIISENSGLIFTANIDGYHGLKNGFEVGYVLNETMRSEFLAIHKKLIETSIYSYELEPTRLQLFKTYATHEVARGIKPPEFPNNISVFLNKDLANYKNEFVTKPVFLGRSSDTDYLIVGNLFFICRYKDGAFHILQKTKPKFNISRFILKYSNLKIVLN